jgi:hypothetical protein
MMDGAMLVPVITLGDLVEATILKKSSFAQLRTQIYQWMRDRNHFLISVDRVGADSVYIILVTYWDNEGSKKTESFDEWAEYTKTQPVSTW